jgi:hypothetical protein
MMKNGSLTSVDVVNAFLTQIAQHNHNGMKLRAVIDAAPWDLAIKQAEMLDKEGLSKGPRSPLHGIPFLVKVFNPVCERKYLLTCVSLGQPSYGSFSRNGNDKRHTRFAWRAAEGK